MNKTIYQVIRDNLCTGCGGCQALCPVDAIELTINEKLGIYVPKINNAKCIDCGICLRFCPGHEIHFPELNMNIFGELPKDHHIGYFLNCYIGYTTNHKLRYDSSSGGLLTQTLAFALEEGLIDGALVTRMKKNNPLDTEAFIARTYEDVIEASGSKYCPTPSNVALREIIKAKETERFAVVGLPCHMHFIRKAEIGNRKLYKRIALHLGLFCVFNINKLGTKFLLNRLNINPKSIKTIRYRGNGWPGGMEIIFKNNTKKFIKTSDYYDNLFTAFKPHRCMLCCDHTCELSDISFGDAWQLKDIDKIGSSIVISRSKKAEKILLDMFNKDNIKISRITDMDVKRSQDFMNFKKRDLFPRMQLLKLFRIRTPEYEFSKSYFKPPSISVTNTPNALLPFIENYLINHKQWKLLKLELKIKSKIS